MPDPDPQNTLEGAEPPLNQGEEKKREFAILTALLIISRGMDLAVTAWYSPDLSMEANPVVAFLNWHWKGLIFTTMTVLGGVLACLFYDVFFYTTEYPREPGLAFRDFADLHWFGRRRPLIFYLLSFARNWDLRIKFVGYAGSRLLIFTGFLVSFCWIAIHTSLGISYLYDLVFPWFPYGLLVPGALYLLYAFLQREYRIYLVQNVFL